LSGSSERVNELCSFFYNSSCGVVGFKDELGFIDLKLSTGEEMPNEFVLQIVGNKENFEVGFSAKSICVYELSDDIAKAISPEGDFELAIDLSIKKLSPSCRLVKRVYLENISNGKLKNVDVLPQSFGYTCGDVAKSVIDILGSFNSINIVKLHLVEKDEFIKELNDLKDKLCNWYRNNSLNFRPIDDYDENLFVEDVINYFSLKMSASEIYGGIHPRITFSKNNEVGTPTLEKVDSIC